MKQMTKKVILAVFDRDLKARLHGKYPVTDDGSKIRVRTGGKRNFNPSFDNNSYIEFPYQNLFTLFRTRWRRVYFVRNGAKACVNFRTEEVLEPDPESVMRAAENKILESIGSEKVETAFITYIILVVLVGIALKVFGVIV